MSTPVCHKASAGFFIPAPSTPECLFFPGINADRWIQFMIIVNIRIGAEPFFPIQIDGQTLFRKIIRCWWRTHPGIDTVNSAQSPFASQPYGMLEIRVRALLTSYTKNNVVLSDLFHDPVTFLNGERQWFLQIDIFSSTGGVNRLKCVPVIRRRDHNRIDILTIQNLLIILIGINFNGLLLLLLILPDHHFKALSFHSIHISSGNNFDTRDFIKSINQKNSLSTQANNPHSNGIIYTRSATFH